MNTRSVYGAMLFGIVAAIPVVLVASLAGAFLYRLLTNPWPRLQTFAFTGVAAVGAVVLAATPAVAGRVRLEMFARNSIPVYPESERIELTIRPAPAAYISIRGSALRRLHPR